MGLVFVGFESLVLRLLYRMPISTAIFART
jgi:hypothetical protein